MGGVSPSPVAEMGQQCTIERIFVCLDDSKVLFLLNLDVCIAPRD